MTIHIHIGLHKTGTSSLQNYLLLNEKLLATMGWSYPSAGRINGAHHNVAYQLRSLGRFVPGAGSIEDCIREAKNFSHGIISTEEFEFFKPVEIIKLRDALEGTPSRILVYLRRQDTLIPSTFTQQARMGARVPDLAGFIDTEIAHPRYDLRALVLRWAEAFGPDALEVGVLNESDSGESLYDDFLGKLGLLHASSRLAKPRQPSNQSPGWPVVEAVRRVSLHLRGRGPPLPPQLLKDMLAATTAIVMKNRALRNTSKPGLTREQWGRVAKHFSLSNATLSAECRLAPEKTKALGFDVAPDTFASPLPETLMQELVAEVLCEMESRSYTASS